MKIITNHLQKTLTFKILPENWQYERNDRLLKEFFFKRRKFCLLSVLNVIAVPVCPSEGVIPVLRERVLLAGVSETDAEPSFIDVAGPAATFASSSTTSPSTSTSEIGNFPNDGGAFRHFVAKCSASFARAICRPQNRQLIMSAIPSCFSNFFLLDVLAGL